MRCRHCKSNLDNIFLDLGFAPPSNAYISIEQLQKPELTFPLKLYVCIECWLVQTVDYNNASDLFTESYAYFSSTSSSWLAHAENYANKIINYLNLTNKSYVVEIASNDGYLLKNFKSKKIPCLGIEPTKSTADAAEKIGIPTLRKFFGADIALALARDNKLADLICGNNVYAHVPDINDFTKGLKILLKKEGIINLEFPHLLNLINKKQFDTVYHEHFSYLSLYTVSRVFESNDLRIFDVEEIHTHGGSLRIYGCHKNDSRKTTSAVSAIIKKEINFGLLDLGVYKNFQDITNKIKNNFLLFLLKQKKYKKSVIAYGAAAKGNTLINFAGVKNDLISFVCDASHSKQGLYMPGSHIPILPPDEIFKLRPDWIIILPWNISDEIKSNYKDIVKWGGKFVTFIPELKIFS